jgi:hypothetical protein
MRLYPYPCLHEGVRLFISRGELLPLGTTLSSSELNTTWSLIQLSGRDPNTHPRARLHAEAFASADDLDRLQALGSATVKATLIAQCRATHLRVGFPLCPVAGQYGKWDGTLELDRRQITGSVLIRAVLTDETAGMEHRLLAASEPWTLVDGMAETPSSLGEFAPDVRWLNFRTTETPHIQKESDQPYYLDLYGAKPVVYLNAGFPGLPEVFPTDGKPAGLLLPLHETLSIGISRSVWQALFYAALGQASVCIDDDTEPEGPTGWQAQVLVHLLPRIYPGLSSSEALRQVRKDVVGEGAGPLQSRLLSAINALVGDGKSLRRSLAALEELNLRRQDADV